MKHERLHRVLETVLERRWGKLGKAMMPKKWTAPGGLAGLCVAAMAPAALADQPISNAFLYCEGSEALVVFGASEDNSPPVFTGGKWKDAKPAPGNKCILANGQKVLLKYTAYPGYPWGAGGADPPADFNLWIDGRFVQGGRFKNGYGDFRPGIDSITYTPGTLRTCGGNPVACVDKPFDIATLRADPASPDFDDPRTGSITFTTAASPSFCRRFIHPQHDAPDALHVFVTRGADHREMLAYEADKLEFMTGRSIREGYSEYASVSEFDAFNLGKPQTVVSFLGEHKLFLGGYSLGYKGIASEEQVAALLKLGGGRPDDAFFSEARKAGWTHLGGEADPYAYHDIFRIDGQAYVFEHKQPMYTTSNPTPTAVLYSTSGFTAGGNEYRAAVPLCTFQIAEGN
jgi:hypothetical protein